MTIQVREQVQFREVDGNAKQTLHIADHPADHAKSMKVIADNGLRPLTYEEALSRYSELITELKGKWFYLAGEGIQRKGIYTFTDEGELKSATGNEFYAKTVRVYPGNNPLSLDVFPDNYARDFGRRFRLGANYSPDVVAPVVVGVKLAQTDTRAETNVQVDELLGTIRSGVITGQNAAYILKDIDELARLLRQSQ